MVLKKVDRGEADKLLVVYTQEFGRIEIVARGIRKIVSKLRPAVEFAAIIELEFIQGKTSKTLTDALVVGILDGARKDLGKTAMYRRVIEFTEKAVKEQQKDPAVWGLLEATLVYLKDASEKSFDAICNYFIWHLFEICGWRPELSQGFAKPQEAALARFFRDADIERSARVRLTKKQSQQMAQVADKYFSLVTK